MEIKNIIYKIVIVMGIAFITSKILFRIYNFLIKKPVNSRFSSKINWFTEGLSMSTGPFCVVMSTFVLDSILKLKFNDPKTDIYNFLSTGIVIVISMIFQSMLFKVFHKKIFNGEFNTGLVLLNYLIGCIGAIFLSFFYIHNWSLALSWFVILLGKFIWFDGTSFKKVIHDIKNEINSKKDYVLIILSDIVVLLLLLATLKIYEITNFELIFYVYGGIFFGMAFTGVVIVIKEEREMIKVSNDVEIK